MRSRRTVPGTANGHIVHGFLRRGKPLSMTAFSQELNQYFSGLQYGRRCLTSDRGGTDNK
jgi:hypothetical protein